MVQDSDIDPQFGEIEAAIGEIYINPAYYDFFHDPVNVRTLISDTAVSMIDLDDFYTNHLDDPAFVTGADEDRYATMLFKRARDKVYDDMAQDYLKSDQAEVLF